MKNTFETILKSENLSYSRDGYFAVHNGLARGSDPAYIVRQLPLEDRIRLYSFMTDPENLETKDITVDAYLEITTTIGKTINFKNDETLQTALKVIKAQSDTSAEKLPAEKSDADSEPKHLNIAEAHKQFWLACVIRSDLPNAAEITANVFMKTRLDEDSQGAALALLIANREEENSTVNQARTILKQEIILTPSVWHGFCQASKTLIHNPASYQDCVTKLVDYIVGSQIMDLSPAQITSLSDRQAYCYIDGLTWAGEQTATFEATRAYLFRYLDVAKTQTERRNQQIDEQLAYFLSLSDDEINGWLKSKNNWPLLNATDKADSLRSYLSVMGRILATPQQPTMHLTSWADAPADKPASMSNGYFQGWKVTQVDGKPQNQWVNEIYLIDDVQNSGRPLSTKRSFRSALSTSSHEFLHSDDKQTSARFMGDSNHQSFIDTFDSDKPAKIIAGDPLFYVSGILSRTSSGTNNRNRYITPEVSYWNYRHQPYEKWAWSFQNQFAATLNGTLVTKQVERGDRILHEELNEVFKKTALVLTARKTLFGNDADIVPLKTYDHAEHPFGVLTVRDGETVSPAAAETGANHIAIDYSKFDGKLETLVYFQKSLDQIKAAGSSKDGDFLPLFERSSDFLIQLSDELWAMKSKLGKDDAVLADKLGDLSASSHELGEDLNDYAFVTNRRKEIAERGDHRQKVVADLTASL